jgi:glutaminyl-peptide cyclotransferase
MDEKTETKNMIRSRSKLAATIVSLLLMAIAGGGIALFTSSEDTSAAEWKPPEPLDTKRAFQTIQTICKFGPRVSGTPAMKAQQDWLLAEFTKLGGQVTWQEFAVRHPLDGSTVKLKNMIIAFGPASKDRLLICAHYDTRPFPDMDRANPRGLFLGANDGASGASLLLELGHAFQKSPPNIGVDLVLFDAEELVYNPDDRYFLGSEHFARTYLTRPAEQAPYRYAVLVDMIGDKNLEIYYEENSFRYAPELTKKIWKLASDLKIKAFVPKLGHNVNDDHLALNTIAAIPACDIIDFDYPSRGRRADVNYWHTTEDLPNKCSGESICKVAAVLLRWIEVESK